MKEDPGYADAHNNLGILLQQTKRFPEAEAAYRRALEIRPNHADAHSNLGNLLKQVNRFSEAEAAYRRALEIRPDHADAHHNLGNLLKQVNRFPEAEAAYRRALEIRPNHADAHSNLGNLLKQVNRFPEAEAAYRRALEIRPNHADAHSNLGNLLKQVNRFPEAEAAYRRALEIRPDHAEAHNNLGILLQQAKRDSEAEAAYRRVLEIQPDHVEAHNNLGNLLKQVNRFSEAEAAYRRALEIRPDHAEAHHNLGLLLQDMKRFPEAEAACRRAVEIRPEDAEPHHNLGFLLQEMRRFSEAEAAYRRALEIRPDHVEARYNLGLLLLYTGRLSEGWPLYEARYHENKSGRLVEPALAYPQWQGESLEGKSILVHWEQGLGDQIQFVRYVPLLKAMGARSITLICAAPLQSLLEGIEGVDAVLSADEVANAPLHDYWTFLLSLPLHFATTLDSIPAAVPYLKADPDRLDAWKPRLPAAERRIGLVWAGSAAHENDRNRSLPCLAALAPVWDIPGIHFVSLQKGPGEDEAAAPPPGQQLTHLGGDIRDFADSAAIVAQLDLIICVDTAVAHLAGALGKPCWILLPRISTDWRWLHERTDSPWYPGTMRLFRQRDLDDWAPTILEVAQSLRSFCHDRRLDRP